MFPTLTKARNQGEEWKTSVSSRKNNQEDIRDRTRPLNKSSSERCLGSTSTQISENVSNQGLFLLSSYLDTRDEKLALRFKRKKGKKHKIEIKKDIGKVREKTIPKHTRERNLQSAHLDFINSSNESQNSELSSIPLSEKEQIFSCIKQVKKLSSYSEELIINIKPIEESYSRVLKKLQTNYVQLFEKLLKATVSAYTTKEKTLRNEADDLCEKIRELRVQNENLEKKTIHLASINVAKETLAQSLEERVKELEDDVVTLREIIRGDAEDAVKRAKTPGNYQRGRMQTFNHGVGETMSKALSDMLFHNGSIKKGLQKPLQDLSEIISEVEVQEDTNEILLHNMSRLLELAQHKSKLGHYEDEKSNGASEIVPVKECATMTTQSALFGGDYLDRDTDVGSVDVLYTSPPISYQTLWWRAFTFARCPRCKIDVQKEVTAEELLQHHRGNKESSAPPSSKRTNKRKSIKENSSTQKGEEKKKDVKDVKPRQSKPALDSTAENSKSIPEESIHSSMVLKILNGNKVGFVVPESFSKFLSNLPEEVLGYPVRDADWLYEQIDTFYDLKYQADCSDRDDGMALQKVDQFIIEQLLLKHELRRIAEMYAFELLMSIKTHLKKHRKVKLFARFMGAYFPNGKEEDISDLSTVQVVLFLRHNLLKQSNKEKLENGSIAESHVIYGENRSQFVPISRAINAITPIFNDILPPRKVTLHCRAIENESYVETRTKTVRGDYERRISKAQGIESGDRMTIRMKMRKAMLANKALAKNAEDKPSAGMTDEKVKVALAPIGAFLSSGNKGKKESKESGETASTDVGTVKTVVASVDAVMEKMVQILQMRKNQVSGRLKRIFDEGDTDGNGVLSFTEFSNIIAKIAPNMTSRMVLRMFRYAVTTTDNQNLSLTASVFQRVCKEYDIPALVRLSTINMDEYV